MNSEHARQAGMGPHNNHLSGGILRRIRFPSIPLPLIALAQVASRRGVLGSAVMGKGARSGRRSRASGAGGGGCGSKRPRRVAEEEQEEEQEEEVEPVEGEDEEDYCFVCKDGGDLRVCDFRFAPYPFSPGLSSSHLMIRR